MYDIIIIGCGPAGLTASIYAKRANKKVLLLEKESIGGQIASSPLVENYPGYKSISGSELANNMFEQVMDLGVDLEIETVTSIINDKIKKVITENNAYETKTIIIATGAKYRLLGLDNEINLIGNGIHFCVSCDGAFYKNKNVAVIGGGNSAVINAIALSDICNKVYIIQNKDVLTAELNLQDNLKSKSNVEIITSANVKKLVGVNELKGISITKDNKDEELKLDGMFISIGLIPQNEIFKELINLDNNNYIISNDCNTNTEGIFVAGDSRTKSYRQLTTAVNDGTISANLAIAYLNK